MIKEEVSISALASKLWWYIPIIPAIQGAEAEGSQIQGQPGNLAGLDLKVKI